MTKIRRLRKGELKFYLTMYPHELTKYIKDFPQNLPYVEFFTSKYEYNYKKKKWEKNK